LPKILHMNTLFALLLLGGDANASNATATLLFYGLMFIIILWFFIISPQRRREKAQKDFLGTLKKGDKVVTIGGIHGKIAQINEGTVLIQVDPNTKLKIQKDGISIEASQQLNAPEKSA